MTSYSKQDLNIGTSSQTDIEADLASNAYPDIHLQDFEHPISILTDSSQMYSQPENDIQSIK